MPKKHSSLIMARHPGIIEKGLETSKGTLHFNGQSGMHVSDPGLVAEIEARHGRSGSGDVWTHQDERLEHHRNYHGDHIHNYMFAGFPDAPSGNERVTVKTADGVTMVSRQVAIEEGLTIVKPRKRK